MEPNSPSPYQSYEIDPRWTAVDQYVLQHLHPARTPYASALQYALDHSKTNGLPDIAVSPLQGKFNALQCRLLGVRHALEIGTLGGYISIWLAILNADLRITSLEIDAKHAKVAREAIKHAGLSDRIEVLLGPALETLPKLQEEITLGKREKFGFVFIDADKDNNLPYYQQAVPMCVSRACIIVDNVVRKGNVAKAELAETDSRVEGARRVIEGMGRDERVDACLMQTVGEKNYDGFLMCVVK
ncbi:hypothetical protein LTR28_008622 [Elasticomyces elasticus]|nr:hypothetical protein LTR28_008622 [Elasticomyces elasticus]